MNDLEYEVIDQAAETEAKARRVKIAVGILAGVLYGLFVRITFGLGSPSGLVSTLTWGFITVVPLGIGALTIYFSPRKLRSQYRYALSATLTASIIFFLLVMVFAFEVFICILMAAPFFLIISMIGGVLMTWLLNQIGRRSQYVLVLLLALPYLMSITETRLPPPPDSFRTVHNQIEIDAAPEQVWQNIIRVPTIQPEEQRFTVFHLIGVPQPLEATMTFEGVGGVRYGKFEDGLLFVERITDWQPERSVSFTIQVENSADVNAPFNEIGGMVFDMVDGTYTIEPHPEGSVILHFTSTHRLTTRFNAYGGIWTDSIMYDLQRYILEIIKQRCEGGN